MKKLSILLLLAAMSSVSFAQDIAQKDVPAVVLNAFQQKFPNQTDVDWEFKHNLYEAEFEIKNMDHDVYIDSTGKIVKYKKEITSAELPAAVTSSIQKNFVGYTIDDVKKTEEASAHTYKVELKKGLEERKVVFGVDGKIIENKLD